MIKVAKKFADAGKNVHFAVSSATDLRCELHEFALKLTSDKPVVSARDSADQKFVMQEEFR